MAATKRRADFTNVKEGGAFRPRRKPEGDYEAKCVAVDDHEFKNDATKEGWVFTFKIKGDERSSYPVYASTDSKEVWKVRKMFMAAGIPVPKRAVLVDPNKLVGKSMGVSLEDDEYEGRMKSVIADWMPLDDLGATEDDDDDAVEDEEEAPPPRKRTARKRAPVEDDEDDDDEDVEEEPAPRRRAAAKKTAARRRAPDPEDDEEDDDEEEPPPPRKRAAKKAAPRRRRQADPDEDDDDLDLEEI
jgi:hypothetical protein